MTLAYGVGMLCPGDDRGGLDPVYQKETFPAAQHIL